jgi:Bacterial PH domain
MRQPAAATIFLICSMLLLLWFGVLVVVSPSGISLIGLGVIGVVLALAARTLLLKVVANESGLFVRNTLRTRRFTWNEVEDFALGQQLGADVVNVLLRNGHVVPLDVTSISWPFVRGETAKREQTMETLRQWLPSQNASS